MQSRLKLLQVSKKKKKKEKKKEGGGGGGVGLDTQQLGAHHIRLGF